MINSGTLVNKNLFKIDSRIDELVKKIELLNYVNPINIESEKTRCGQQIDQKGCI